MQALQQAFQTGLVVAWLACNPLHVAAQTVEVTIRDYKFEPATVQVKLGHSVKWTNQEKRANHSVFFTGPDGQESERLFPGESWARVFDKPGTYLYTCGPHPEMTGKVVVTE